MRSRYSQNGFTLIELAIVLVIIGLLLGGVLTPFTAQKEQERRTEAFDYLDEAKEALLGYAIVNNRLPCPDTDIPPDGRENGCTAGSGNFRAGTLPWVTLSLEVAEDPWGNPIGYAVNGGFSDLVTRFNLNTAGTGGGILRIFSAQPPNCNLAGDVAEDVPAILWSGGKMNHSTSDENENLDADRCFVSKNYTVAGGSEFDDQMIWLSPNVLFNRMVSAGRLP